MFGLIKKIFMRLLINIVNASNHRKCISLSNQKCEIKPIFINLQPNEHSQEFHHYQFTVKFYKCSVLHRTEHINLIVFNIITGINELKTLKKQKSCN